jgi:hypothetical protein
MLVVQPVGPAVPVTTSYAGRIAFEDTAATVKVFIPPKCNDSSYLLTSRFCEPVLYAEHMASQRFPAQGFVPLPRCHTVNLVCNGSVHLSPGKLVAPQEPDPRPL